MWEGHQPSSLWDRYVATPEVLRCLVASNSSTSDRILVLSVWPRLCSKLWLIYRNIPFPASWEKATWFHLSRGIPLSMMMGPDHWWCSGLGTAENPEQMADTFSLQNKCPTYSSVHYVEYLPGLLLNTPKSWLPPCGAAACQLLSKCESSPSHHGPLA